MPDELFRRQFLKAGVGFIAGTANIGELNSIVFGECVEVPSIF